MITIQLHTIKLYKIKLYAGCLVNSDTNYDNRFFKASCSFS